MRYFKILGLCVILIFGHCTQLDEFRYGEIRQISIYESNFHAAFPGAASMDSGELIVVFREGQDHVSPDGKILLCRSEDHGKNWSEPDTIVSTAWDCRDPSIVQLKDGLVLVNFFQSKYDDQGKIIGAVGCFTVRSFDNGKTFTAPRMVQIPDVDWSATSDGILELNDGSLILPVYGGREGETSSAIAVISRNGGETWKESVVIAKDTTGQIHFQKPALIKLPDGKILCVLRTAGADRFLYQTVSEDSGKTWSLHRSSGIQGQAANLTLTNHGTLLCAYRDFWPRGVSFVRSYDWGRTWEHEIQLSNADDDCAYPSIIPVGDRLMVVHYGVHIRRPKTAEMKSSIQGTIFNVHPPEAPRGFSVSVQGDEQINLRWNSVEGAVYYNIYRDTASDFVPVPGYPFKGNGIATPTFSRYTDVRVDSGRTYYYRVTAVAGEGELIPGTGSESEPTRAIGVEAK